MSPDAIEIYVDADACPVKEEVVRVAMRHKLRVHFVSNSWMRLPEGPDVQRVVVPEGPDVADDWIATRAGKRSVVVTADIPLASRCVKAGASVIGNTGKPMTDANIGMVLATRNLMTHLRETGTATSYNASFSKQDRSRFLQTLEDVVQKLKRG
jgi:uncharacterized protein YaiI (UPF0178 family)